MRVVGKYTAADVKLPDGSLDEATANQIQSFCDCPAFVDTNITIMPDCHAGKGAVVGFTMPLSDVVIPNIIGVDIGCGMASVRLPGKIADFSELDAVIKTRVPSGFAVRNTPTCLEPAFEDELRSWVAVVSADYARVVRSIGSLGGGNHFIEVGECAGANWLTVHTGSRNFGLRIAGYYQELARAAATDEYTCSWKDLEFLQRDSEAGSGYLRAMTFAHAYAALNRRTILQEIVSFYGWSVAELETIESVHNFIGADGIVRKGATSAREHERLLIPFNMRDGIAVCTGKGNASWNFSAPHGAGRVLSRAKAKKNLDLAHFQAQMAAAGVYTTTATAETLDEAPDAYKDTKMILGMIEETAAVDFLLRPVYNFKAGGD